MVDDRGEVVVTRGGSDPVVIVAWDAYNARRLAHAVERLNAWDGR